MAWMLNSKGEVIQEINLIEPAISYIHIYPNPFKDALNIELPQNMTKAQIVLYDLVGKQVLRLNVPGNNQHNTITLDTSTLEPGIYLIHLVSQGGGKYVGKVIRR